MSPPIIRMTSSYRSHLTVEMMLFTSELFIWDLPSVNQQELFLTQVQNTWQLPVFFVTMRQLEIINLKSTIHFQEASFKEIKPTKGARPWAMICINLPAIKFCPRHHQNWLMGQPNYKVSSGKTTPASSHYQRKKEPHPNNSKLTLKLTNALSSNF